jgi:hypothetical protein
MAPGSLATFVEFSGVNQDRHHHPHRMIRPPTGVLVGGESFRKSRMPEIRTSGLTRGAIVLRIVPPHSIGARGCA